MQSYHKYQTMSDRKQDALSDRPCACEGNTLDRLIQPTVMAMLAEGPLHGYALVERLEFSPLMKGSKPNDTGVYRLLAMLEQQGCVSSCCAKSALGPKRRIYQLTPSGQACLKKWLTTLEEYHRNVGELAAILRGLSAQGKKRKKRRSAAR
jgi:DNA-binding PadR family transcriptional regulator